MRQVWDWSCCRERMLGKRLLKGSEGVGRLVTAMLKSGKRRTRSWEEALATTGRI